jgi:single-stranded-DNA-specific exonuclease
VADVDLFAAISANADLLGRFGGHKAAVGVSLPADRLPELRRRLHQTLSSLPAEQFVVRRTVDADLALSEVTTVLARELRVLEPHGAGNPKPVFVASGVRLKDASCVGREANHLRFTAADKTASVPAIAFSCDDIEDRVASADDIGVVFEIEPDEFRGGEGVQMVVRDFVRPA